MPQKFPYTPTAGALVQLLGQLRKSFPPTVDATTLKKLGLAPNNESYNLSVIRFIGLIDEKGAKNSKHQALFSIADDAKFSAEFAKVVHEAYGELFKLHGDAAWALDKPSLSTFFRQSDGTSAVVGDRQVATFVALAEVSGKRSPSAKLQSQPNDSKKKATNSLATKPSAKSEKAIQRRKRDLLPRLTPHSARRTNSIHRVT
jgi:hypothetical protein